ncbi:hypothetical protein BM221_009435 [Beauveria bassiana]|uniref:Uncharacterized protein n=1 Tax=Beauveria bassiana TaxID=176275 RepID=A0A2N6NBE0_BEABA|nr:hypothetical protein BM221_009435 [Beauveria bassiana]
MTGRLLSHMLTIEVNNADYRNAPSTSVAFMGYVIATSRLVPELVLSSDMLNTHPGAADRKLPRPCQKKQFSTGVRYFSLPRLGNCAAVHDGHCHQPQAPGVSLKGHSFVGETHHVREQLGAKKEE